MQQSTVLYLVTQGGPWGGAQRYINDLTRVLSQEMGVIVAIGEPHGPRDLQKKLGGCKIIQLRHLKRSISPLHDLLAIFELAHLYTDLKPDIVHLNSTKAGILGSLARLLVRHPPRIIYTVHGWVFNEPILWIVGIVKTMYRLLERFTARWKDAIIVLSLQDKKDGEETAHIHPSKMALIPLGVSLTSNPLTQGEARSQLAKFLPKKQEATGYWIGTIANFYPTKGLDILIKAVAIFKDNIPSLSVSIIGEGPERKKLETLISTHHLQSTVFLTGFLENASHYLPAFDLFVLPSRKEGLPYTILEAQSYNLPIIATEVGGIPSIIHNKKNGLLIPKENAEALAEALHYAYQHQEEMKIMGMRGSFQQLSIEEMAQKTKELYQSLLQEESR